MNRPLVPVVMAYAAGLVLAECLHPPMWLLAGITGILLVLILVLVLGFKQRSRFLVWPLLTMLAWTSSAYRTSITSPTDLRVLMTHDPALVTVRGTLAEPPHYKITERNQQERWRSVVRVRISEIKRETDFQPAHGEVVVTTPNVLEPEFFTGQPVEIAGVMARPPPRLAEGLFDYRAYLATRGIYYELKTDSTHDWKLREPHAARPPLTDRFLAWSRGVLALGLPAEDEPLRLLWAMTLDWRTAFTGEIADPYLQAGTMHMFAIDGLRIALVSGMIVTLLRMLRLSRAWCGLIAVPVIWFYTAATGWESSAIRASIMMTIVLGGWALKRPGDLLNSLAAAALIILLLDPRQMFEASFQLSFFVMLVIALMLPPLNNFSEYVIQRAINPDPLLPEELVPRWRRSLAQPARWLAQFTALSFAAWMGSLPLAAKYFHLFSPVSTPANVLAVPLGALALTANLGALICGHWLPWITGLFNHAAWFLMVAMTWVSVKSAALPGAYFYVPEPSVTAIVLYYVVLIALFSGWFKTRLRKWLGTVLLAAMFAGGFWQWASWHAQTVITALPLEGGHAVYVDAPGRQNDWLINCGNTGAVDYTLKDFLRAQGVNRLPRLVLADGNARNSGGVRRLDDLFGIGELWTSAMKFRSPAYREAVAAFDNTETAAQEKSPRQHHILSRGQTNGCWQVLFPAADTAVARADEAPLVLRGDFRGTKILLLSDLGRAGQSELLSLAATNELRADIVIAGLPDQGEPLCNDLLAAIQPRAIVLADSEYPATRRVPRALRERLAASKIPVIDTRTSGAVRIVISGKADGRWTIEDGQGKAVGTD